MSDLNPYRWEEIFQIDSLHKDFIFTSFRETHPEDPPELTLTNEDIVSESVELTESLCTEESVKFNSIETNMLKFSVRSTVRNINGWWFHVDIKVIDPFGIPAPITFRLGDYMVASDIDTKNGLTRDITAYDGLYKIMNWTHKGWYNSMFELGNRPTLKEFRDSFFTYLAIDRHRSWIVQEDTTLVNDDIVLKKSKKIKKPTTRDILGTICELNGVIGHLGRDGTFKYISLESTEQDEEIELDDAFTIAAQAEDYTVAPIDRVEILAQDGEVLGAYGETEDDAENTYTIENGFLLKGLGDGTSAQATATLMATRIYGKIHSISYVPFDGDFKGNPFYEVGDKVAFSIKTRVVHSIIMSRLLTGVQSLRDTYSASGKETYSGDANVLSNMIKNISQQIGQESSSKNVMVEPLYTSGVPIAKITIDGVETILYAPEGGGGGGGTSYRLSAHNRLQLLDYTEVT